MLKRWWCGIVFVSFACGRLMGMETKLHFAAARGESEELQQLLDTGAYDVIEKDWSAVCKEWERERGRGVDLLFLPSHLHSVDCVRWITVGMYCDFMRWDLRCLCVCVCTDCVDRLLSIMRHGKATVSVSVDWSQRKQMSTQKMLAELYSLLSFSFPSLSLSSLSLLWIYFPPSLSP